jgi:hypothetical protein
MAFSDNYELLLVREQTAKRICADLNNFVDLRSTLMTIIDHIKGLTACEAVGIRLLDDGDYPYYVHSGFSATFIMKENSLCTKNGQGQRTPSAEGEGYLLDCMCGNVIQGRFDSSQPFFTERGSFWSNHTTALLATTTDADRQARTRNYCNSSGYESVALIPVRAQGERIGLIQLNDHRKTMFDKSLIEYMEMIAEHVGLAVRNALIHSKLKAALDEIRVLRGILPICAGCKKIRDDRGYWTQIERYIAERTEAEFSHGICPDCALRLYPDSCRKKNDATVRDDKVSA